MVKALSRSKVEHSIGQCDLSFAKQPRPPLFRTGLRGSMKRIRRLPSSRRARRQARVLDHQGRLRLDEEVSVDVQAALKNRQSHFVIDGAAVILGPDGRSDFNALHHGEVQLCAFDVLAIGGEDLRALPISMRKTYLERLLRGRPDGIVVSPFEIRSAQTCFARPARWAWKASLKAE